MSLIDLIHFIFRYGMTRAEYLPVKIAFDQKTKRLHPEPVRNAKWISVCGEDDRQCHQEICTKTKKRV